MFTAEAEIRPRSKSHCENLVLYHPAAKIVFGRPAGTAWFSCRKGCEGAFERAWQLKEQWEKTFQQMATKYCDARLCLDTTGS